MAKATFSEEKARSILAEEAEREGFTGWAEKLRAGENNSPISIRAMLRFLSEAQSHETQ